MAQIKNIDSNFNTVSIRLLPPEEILARSFGEITKSDTKNHRTQKSELGGPYCPITFGAEEDFKCSCGKFKGIKYKGIVCDKCSVQVNKKSMRRKRVGHIKLCKPVINPVLNRLHPHPIAALLGLSSKAYKQIANRSLRIVMQPGKAKKEGIKKGDLLTTREVNKLEAMLAAKGKSTAADGDAIISETGAEAFKKCLKALDLDKRAEEERDKVVNETSQQRKNEAIKRLSIIESFRRARKNGTPNKPEWMILDYIMVISPPYRPMFPLDNGRFVTADLSKLYQIIIMRNNRLKKIMDIHAPEAILNNEIRMLQSAVDELMDGPQRAVKSFTKQPPLKSIGAHLSGKRGLIRGKMLGKRVDFSGRTAIVSGPRLKLNQCGLPKHMALILFSPKIIKLLLWRGVIKTFKEGRQIIDEKQPIVWPLLESVIKGEVVLLNRQPTLHRLGIMAFEVVLIEGSAIQLHPLCCRAFNADHDGDTMCVLLPMTALAVTEARNLMRPSQNLLNPSNGVPIIYPTKDMIAGLYHLTKKVKSTPEEPLEEGTLFANFDEVLIALNTHRLSKHAHIKVRVSDGKAGPYILETVAGRVLFNQYVPNELGFVNEPITSSTMETIVNNAIREVGMERTSVFLDHIKDLGFYHMHTGGLTFGLDDMQGPPDKQEKIQKAEEEVAACNEKYYMGLLTDNERYNKVIDIWTRVGSEFTESTLRQLERHKNGHNTLWCMYASGARGSRDQMNQMVGGKGLVTKMRSGEKNATIGEVPILRCYREGLTRAGFLQSTEGSRGGLADSTGKTAEAGYFFRKLIDLLHNQVITQKKCNTLRGREIKPIYMNGRIKHPISHQVIGRVPIADVVDPQTRKVIAKRGEPISKAIAQRIDDAKIRSIKICSPVFCASEQGICSWCYGMSLSNNKMSEVGDAVGNVSAQSITEPVTQMVLRTFQKGGTAGSSLLDDVVKALERGIVRIENLQSVLLDGKTIVTNRNAELTLFDAKTNQEIQSHVIPYGSNLLVKSGAEVESGAVLFEMDIYKIPILTHVGGTVSFDGLKKDITYKEEYSRATGLKGKIIIESQEKGLEPKIIVTNDKGHKSAYPLPITAQIVVEEGAKVRPGMILAKISRPKSTLHDMAGGLPRITKLFEMQKIINKAVMSHLDGYVTLGAHKRGKLEIEVKGKTGLTQTYKVPVSRQLLVQNGDYVKAGTLITDGLVAAEDILEVGGLDRFVDYIILSVQDIYEQQGIALNNKHIEIVLRQMLQKVQVISFGDTSFVPTTLVSRVEFARANRKFEGKKIIVEAGDSAFKPGDLVSVHEVEVENQVLVEQNKKPATVRDPKPAVGKAIAQGITAASITSDSFIAAASFQETIKALTSAAIEGKQDPIKGIKESVICSKLIPAGSGMKRYNRLRVTSKEVRESFAEKKY